MNFFGSVFAALTLSWHLQLRGPVLALPFATFVVIGLVAVWIIRLPGRGIMWSTIGEGAGLFIAANLVMNLHRPELLLPAMMLVVGLHFLPIAHAAAFQPFMALGAALILCAFAGAIMGPRYGSEVAGTGAACGLWLAAIMALRRNWRAKRTTLTGD